MQTSKIQALRARCLLAARRGYHIARARDYIRSLEAMVGPVTLPAGVTAGSPAHLRMLCDAALAEGAQMDSAPQAPVDSDLASVLEEPATVADPVESVAEPVPEPAPMVMEPAPEEPAPMVMEPAPEEPAEEVPLAVAVETLPEAVAVQDVLAVEAQPLSFETWTMDELMAEAKARNLKGRNKMSKDELVAALTAAATPRA